MKEKLLIAIHKVRAELRDSLRLRIAALLACWLLALYMAFSASDWREQQTKQFASALSRLEHVRLITAQEDWNERAASAQSQSDSLSGLIWQAETRGLAQATFQSWVSEQAQAVGVTLSKNDVLVSDEPDQETGLYIVNGRITGKFEPVAFHRLLSRIDGGDKVVVVDRVDVRAVTDGGSFEIVFRAFFSVSGAPKNVNAERGGA